MANVIIKRKTINDPYANPNLKWQVVSIESTDISNSVYCALIHTWFESKEQAIAHLQHLSNYNNVQLIPIFV